MVYTPHEHIRMRNEDGEIMGCFDLEDCKRRSKEAYERDGEDSEGCDQCGGPYLLVDKNHIIAVLNKGLNHCIYPVNETDAKLIADAPLLLAEVKRLRDFIQSVWDGLGEAGRNEHYELFREYMGEEE